MDEAGGQRRPHQLHVVVHCASDLEGGFFWSGNPSVVVALNGHSWTTSTIKNTTNPVWNEKLEFDCQDIDCENKDGSGVLVCTVCDESVTNPTAFMGLAVVPISSLMHGEAVTQWYTLVNQDYCIPVREGQSSPPQLKLTLHLIVEGAESPPPAFVGYGGIMCVQELQDIKNRLMAAGCHDNCGNDNDESETTTTHTHGEISNWIERILEEKKASSERYGSLQHRTGEAKDDVLVLSCEGESPRRTTVSSEATTTLGNIEKLLQERSDNAKDSSSRAQGTYSWVERLLNEKEESAEQLEVCKGELVSLHSQAQVLKTAAGELARIDDLLQERRTGLPAESSYCLIRQVLDERASMVSQLSELVTKEEEARAEIVMLRQTCLQQSVSELDMGSHYHQPSPSEGSLVEEVAEATKLLGELKTQVYNATTSMGAEQSKDSPPPLPPREKQSPQLEKGGGGEENKAYKADEADEADEEVNGDGKDKDEQEGHVNTQTKAAVVGVDSSSAAAPTETHSSVGSPIADNEMWGVTRTEAQLQAFIQQHSPYYHLIKKPKEANPSKTTHIFWALFHHYAAGGGTGADRADHLTLTKLRRFLVDAQVIRTASGAQQLATGRVTQPPLTSADTDLLFTRILSCGSRKPATSTGNSSPTISRKKRPARHSNNQLDFHQFTAFMRAVAAKVSGVKSSKAAPQSPRQPSREAWLSLLTTNILPLAASLSKSLVIEEDPQLREDAKIISTQPFQGIVRSELASLRAMFRAFKSNSSSTMKFDEFSNCCRSCHVIPTIPPAQLHGIYSTVMREWPETKSGAVDQPIDSATFLQLLLLCAVVATRRRDPDESISVEAGASIALQEWISCWKNT